jgi:transcriptional regulator with XRE-family HTH domain
MELQNRKGGDEMIDFVKVGKKIADLRRSNGLSQDDLAEKLFVTRQAVSKWENGMSVPTIDTLSDICRIFFVSFEELLGLFDKERLVLDPDDIFRGHDRSFIVSKIANGEIEVDLASVFYQMSPAERMFLLKHVREGALKVDMTELAAKLTPSEARYLERS